MSNRFARTMAHALVQFAALIVAIATLAGAGRAQTIQNWTFKVLDDSNQYAPGTTSANGINDAGTAVGNYLLRNSSYWIYGFQYSGKYTDIVVNQGGCTNACDTIPYGINNSGEIAGEYDDPNYYQHGFYGSKGRYTVFDFPGAAYTIPNGISNKGMIVGFYEEYPGLDERDTQWGANVNGFVYTPGSGSIFHFSELNLPGCAETWLFGINRSGTVVGDCPGSASTAKFYGIAYNPRTGSQINLIVQGAASTRAYGINDAGQIVGAYWVGSPATPHCFLYSSGSYILVPDPPGATGTFCYGVNNAGQVVGEFGDAQGLEHGFIASGPALLDPIPSNTDPGGLLNGPAVGDMSWLQQTTGNVSNGLHGRGVLAIAADGVSELVVRIPAKNVGDQFTFTLINDQNQVSSSAVSDGALGSPDDTSYPTQSSVSTSAIPLTAADGSQSAYAFAVYRAPIDFVRQDSGGSYNTGTQHFFASFGSGFGPRCGGNWPPCAVSIGRSPGPGTDDQLASRGVVIQVEDLSTGNTFSMPVEILRPPVVMIHGLWDNWKTWNNFNPLVNGAYGTDARFSIGRVDYSWGVGKYITGSDPAYPADVLRGVQANSLGFGYNAPFVLADINGWIGNFKLGNNPLGIPAADVQADIITHSMGGDIARTIALQTGFTADGTFGRGNMHKLITIDTPHLGSPLANDLLSPQERGGCVATELASHGKPALRVVQFGGSTTNGAMADLSVGSGALAAMANGQTPVIPTALIAGINPNFHTLPPLIAACYLKGDSLAGADVSASTWTQDIFLGQLNDAIVTETSQLDGLPSQFVFSGVDHSAGVEGSGHGLGFAGPNVLDPNSKTGIPSTVIQILNTPVTSRGFFLVNP